MRVAVTLVVLLLAAVLLGATDGSASPAQATKLVGTVGPEFTITLRDAQGNRVTRLDPGTYEIEIQDRSDFHNFHLRGPGVNESTEVEFMGTVTWNVTLTEGNYTYVCDPHASQMRGAFVAGNPQPAQPPGAAPITARTRVILTSGPSQRITLRTAAGKTVRTMKTGTYNLTVRDRSRLHNAHIRAPGVNRSTTVGFVGTQRWRVRLARPGTLRFLCDPHAAAGMRGSARIVR